MTTSIHTKTNLSCKALTFERLFIGAASHFNVPPSSLVVVDLCSSHAKDLAGLEVAGVEQRHYFGFDNDVESPALAQKHAKTTLHLVTLLNIVDESDHNVNECIRTTLRGAKAHVVLINFAIHLFAKDLEKVFRLIPSWAHEGCFVHISFLPMERVHALIESPGAYGDGVTFKKETRTLSIENLATYVFEEGLHRMTPTIHREESAKTFKNNGVLESLVSLDGVLKAAERHGFESICAPDEFSHMHMYHKTIRTHATTDMTDRERLCLEAFLSIHETIVLKHF